MNVRRPVKRLERILTGLSFGPTMRHTVAAARWALPLVLFLSTAILYWSHVSAAFVANTLNLAALKVAVGQPLPTWAWADQMGSGLSRWATSNPAYGMAAARVLMAQDRYEDALATMQQVVTKRSDAITHYYLATLYSKMGMRAEAGLQLRLAGADVLVRTELNQAIVQGNSHRQKELIVLLLEIQPEEPLNWLLLSNYYLARGVTTGAHRYALQALAIDPQHLDAQIQEAWMGWALDHSRAARSIAAIEAALSRDPKIVVGYLALASIYLDDGNWKRGCAWLSEGQLYFPNNDRLEELANRFQSAGRDCELGSRKEVHAR